MNKLRPEFIPHFTARFLQKIRYRVFLNKRRGAHWKEDTLSSGEILKFFLSKSCYLNFGKILKEKTKTAILFTYKRTVNTRTIIENDLTKWKLFSCIDSAVVEAS